MLNPTLVTTAREPTAIRSNGTAVMANKIAIVGGLGFVKARSFLRPIVALASDVGLLEVAWIRCCNRRRYLLYLLLQFWKI